MLEETDKGNKTIAILYDAISKYMYACAIPWFLGRGFGLRCLSDLWYIYKPPCSLEHKQYEQECGLVRQQRANNKVIVPCALLSHLVVASSQSWKIER